MTTPAAELIGVEKKYGQVRALRGIDLRIEQGETVAMLGPNGAGKTTSISIMLGLRKPTNGQVKLFGLDPNARRARSRCGVMLQESGVPANLRVRELVNLFRSYYPHPMPAASAIELAGLEEKAGEMVSRLSGGQRQRLYFALAICGDPELLFLDEPTVGMDIESRRRFLDTIRGFSAAGKTIVLTTHYLEEADELARRIVVIDRGAVIADASPREIKARVAGRRISFSSPDQLGEPDFRSLPATGLGFKEDRVWMLSNQPEVVLAELFRRGIRIQELEVTGADLEEAFISLTSHPAGDEEAV